MSVRCQWPKHGIVQVTIAICGTLSSPATAQLLKLGGGSEASADAATASSDLASFLEQQAQSIKQSPEVPAARRVSASLRTLAASLLRSGDALGDAGAARSMIGRTIVAQLTEVDAWLGSTPPALSAAAASLLADDLREFSAQLPADDPSLERALRDVLAPMSNAIGTMMPAWPGPDRLSALPTIEQFKASLLPAQQVEAAHLLDMLERARSVASHATSADRIDRVGGGMLRALSDRPKWLGVEAAQIVDDRLLEALRACGTPGEGERGLSLARTLQSVGHSLNLVDDMRAGPGKRLAIEALNGFIVESGLSGRRSERAMQAFDHVIALAADETPSQKEARLPTPMRVAWRAAQGEYDTSRQRTIDALVQLLDAPDPMAEPAMLSALRAMRAQRQLLIDLADTADLLTGLGDAETPPTRPRLAPAHADLGSRLLEEGRALAQSDDRAVQARAFFAAAARCARASAASDAESAVRAAIAAKGPDAQLLELALDGQGEVVLRLIDERRAGIEALLTPQVHAAALEAHALSIESMLIVLEVAWASTVLGRAEPSLRGWGGWELSEAAGTMLHERALERAARMTRTALAAQSSQDRSAVADVLVLARLGAEWDVLAHDRNDRNDRVAALLAQIATGPPPDDAWMIDHRAPLAVMARSVEEWASATLRSETDRVERLEARLEQAAGRVLLLIERSDAR